MRLNTRGWRSARAYPLPAAVGAPASAAPAVRLTPEVSAATAAPYVWPWQNVKWTFAFVAFCVYSVTIITYIAPLGQIAMIAALIGLALGTERVRFPAPLLFFVAYYIWAVAMWPSSNWGIIVKATLLDVGRVVLIFLVAINVLGEKSRLRFYIFLYLAAFALYPVRGAIFNQFIYHAALLGRISWNNMFSNPNDLAALLLSPLGVAAGLLYTERHKYLRTAALVGVALISLIVFLTQSRGGILALAFFGAIVIARQKRRLRMLPALIGVLAVVVLFAPDSVWTRLKNLRTATSSGELLKAEDQGSAEQRFEIWKVAVAISKDHPFTGAGLGAYPYYHWSYARMTMQNFKRTSRGLRDAHSSYLTALAETGVPGLVFWLAVFISAYMYSQRARRIIKHSDPDTERQIFFMQAAMLAFGAAAIFGSWNNIPFPYIHVSLLYSMAYVAIEQQRRAQRTAYAARVA
ncbi:MAG TPA: O-antigen ligase family protein [Gemmatimonadaceae bacterium]|nr:O-antigen ligase family protein [Gemmatimonadaceae bacterium]